MRPRLPREDLDLVLSHTAGFWSRYSGARLFVTGGTGFVGSWLLETIQHANALLGSRLEIAVLTRDPERALARLPHVLGAPNVKLIAGDVASFDVRVGDFDLCIHAAGDAVDAAGATNGLALFDAAVTGTRRVLELAAAGGASRFLLTSSGAVYGRQPPALSRIPETFAGAPDTLDVAAAYAHGKRTAEWLVCAHAGMSGIPATIARIFALLGPNLPFDGPFAVGNFIRDVLDGSAIRIRGDGRPIRSYMYMADLCIWLLRILMSGTPQQAYNVGSEHELSIAELARRVAKVGGTDLPVNVAKEPDPLALDPRYVPDTSKARRELGLEEYTPLDAALLKTIRWSRSAVGHEKV